MTTEVSHGRGGHGNIGPDETKYVDGEVVRTGPEGSQGHGAYSAGRGGAGNIGDPGTPPAKRSDKDLVPEEAYRPSTEGQDFHVGRGGAGNAIDSKKAVVDQTNTDDNAHKDIDHEKRAAAEARANGNAGVSVADKLKAKILGPFHKK